MFTRCGEMPNRRHGYGLMSRMFSELRYYLYGAMIVVTAVILLYLFQIQTGTSSGGSPR